MSTVIPTKLLKLTVLAEVPRSIYMDAPAPVDAQDEKKRLSFLKMLRKAPPKQEAQPVRVGKATYQLNAAVWLRLIDAPSQPVSLVLVYRDQKGEFAVMVDESTLSSPGSVMLSGNVTIEARGPIQYIRACCAGLSPGQRYVVDELYVQKVVSESAPGQKRRA